MGKKIFSIGVLSDKGIIKDRNQDGILVLIGESRGDEFGLFAVADGMGGHMAGEAASKIALSWLKGWWNGILPAYIDSCGKGDWSGNIRGSLDEAVRRANEEVFKYGARIGNRAGTTLSLLFVYNNRYWIKHIGDSRIYKLDRRLEQLTEDHSWVAGQVLRGCLSKEEARKHPKRNILLKCLGMKDRIDLFDMEGKVKNRDLFLLCSDGFYGKLEEWELLSALSEGRDGGYGLQSVAEALFKRIKDRGEADNVSAVLVEAFHTGPGVAATLRRVFTFVRGKGYNRNETQ